MNKMELHVSFPHGTSLVQAVEESKNKAIMLDLAYVVFDFNGITISISKDANIDEVDNHLKSEYSESLMETGVVS
jgi:hypothetical protein